MAEAESAVQAKLGTTALAPRVAYVTAGAGGMICGSCLSDNTLVRALKRAGAEAVLLPVYTPIRTDDHDESLPRVFLGGLNVYLAERLPGYRILPAWLRHLLDRPALLRRITARGVSASPKLQGKLTLSMLAGTHGPQRAEMEELICWICDSFQPDVVHFSNLLIAGCVPDLRRRSGAAVIVSLQGDDVFLETLPEPYRSAARGEMSELGREIDRFVVHSEYYRGFMAEYLDIDREKIEKVTLGIDARDFVPPVGTPTAADRRPRTIGYLARLAPEKGLHLLVDAFVQLRRAREYADRFQDVQLAVAGWTGSAARGYVQEQFSRLDASGLGDAYRYWGVVDRQTKVRFLHSLNVLSVPTVYRDPKGLFALEALAAGVPVVLPAHGAFPELLEASGGGVLCRPEDPADLARRLAQLLDDPPGIDRAARSGQRYVLRHRTSDVMAAEMLAVYGKLPAQGRKTG